MGIAAAHGRIYNPPLRVRKKFVGVEAHIVPEPPLGAQGARKGALPVADPATAAVGQPLALADRSAGREGLVATRRWREAPEGIRTIVHGWAVNPSVSLREPAPLRTGELSSGL